MDAERWKQVDELLQSALQVPSEQRDEFLRQACAGDTGLEQEVRSLLASDQSAGGFLQGPAIKDAAQMIALNEVREIVDVVLGQTISHYRVLKKLGSGGMGVVYEAEDIRLGRHVALKLLLESEATNSKALQRFEQEARAISSLNHPNICTLYEVEEYEGKPVIVMELLEGQTLKERMKAGRVSLNQLPDWGIDVADALDAAHATGVVHRDIKPANLFVTSRGRVKVLDYGLAKLAGPRASLAETLNDEPLTSLGVIVGTTPYMSPEQVRGDDLDARTDIFSLGTALYEMATGQCPFAEKNIALTMDAVLHKRPVPLTQVNSELPLELEHIIEKAIEKDREVRYQSAAELRTDLQQLKSDTDSRKSAAKIPVRQKGRSEASRYKFVLGVAVIFVIILSVGFLWLKSLRPASEKAITERQLTRNPPENRIMGSSISPDGKLLAFVDTRGLHLGSIETGETHDVPLPDELRNRLWEVSWFPDGQKLLITAHSRTEGDVIWKMSVFGGAPHKLWSGSNSAAVSPKDSSIAYVSGGGHELWLAGPDGENPRKLLESKDEQYVCTAWSPTGERVAYLRGTERKVEIETASPSGGATSVISHPGLTLPYPPLACLSWLRDGRLLFEMLDADNEFGNLWQIPVDPSNGVTRGKLGRVTNWHGEGPLWPSAASDGGHLVVVKFRSWVDIYSGEFKGRNLALNSASPLSLTRSSDYISGWTRDSKSVLFQSDRTGKSQIFRQQLGRDDPEPIVPGADVQESPQSSPDGAWILYWSTPVGGRPPASAKRLMRAPASGGPPVRILEAPINGVEFNCPYASSALCILGRLEQDHMAFYKLDPVRGVGKQAAEISTSSASEPTWSVSPDGSRVAVTDSRMLAGQVRILNLTNSTDHVISLVPHWHIWDVTWAADGNSLFAMASQDPDLVILQIELNGKTHLIINQGRAHLLEFPRLSPDGRHLAFSQLTWESNAWLLENF